VIVLDTHALLWWLADSAQLSSRARQLVKRSAGRRELSASAASVMEVATLVRRGRLALSMTFDEWLREVRLLPELAIAPITADIAARAGTYGDGVHGDPVDRLIIATAQLSNARLVTADKAIHSLKIVQSVW
jgi:PIN domain nuclease of toxin-antitoxin system